MLATPGLKHANELTPDELTGRALQRRAVEAVIWGMPATPFPCLSGRRGFVAVYAHGVLRERGTEPWPFRSHDSTVSRWIRMVLPSRRTPGMWPSWMSW